MISNAQLLARTSVHAYAPAHCSFNVRVTPHRSMRADHLLIFIAIAVAVSVTLQAACVLANAWPAAIFIAFDTLFLVGALIVSQSRLQRHEDIAIRGRRLTIERYDRTSCCFRKTMSCYRLSIVRHEDPEFGLRELHLWSGEDHAEIARDLSPPERETFFNALLTALRDTGLAPIVHHHALGLHPAVDVPSSSKWDCHQ